MITSLALLHDEPGPLEQHIIDVAARSLPDEFHWASRARGDGPWTAFLGQDRTDRLVFARHDGSKEVIVPSRIRPLGAGKSDPQWQKDLFQAMQAGTRLSSCYEPGKGTSDFSFMLLRRTSLIILGFAEEGPPDTADYYLSRNADAHDLLEDLPELHRLFPGLFLLHEGDRR